MELTAEDKKILRECFGESEKDIEQIEEFLDETVYELIDNKTGAEKKISAKKAIKLLGRRAFLAGLDRSTFHWSAVIDVSDNEDLYVFFDSSAYWRQILKDEERFSRVVG